MRFWQRLGSRQMNRKMDISGVKHMEEREAGEMYKRFEMW